MSAYGSVDVPGFWDHHDAEPYCDVAHDSGCYGGKVRLIVGLDYVSAHETELTPEQARGLAEALLEAARLAEDQATAATWWAERRLEATESGASYGGVVRDHQFVHGKLSGGRESVHKEER